MNSMKSIKILLAATAPLAVLADLSVSGVKLEDDGSGDAVITYTLSGAPAVVTLDIETNDLGEWESIGGQHVRNIPGDAPMFRRVEADGTYSFKWRASADWPGNSLASGVRAKVTAWPVTNTPAYMVVDISSTATAATPKRYYPAVEFLPGGILDNLDYRTTKLVMRKVMAKGVTWKMGSNNSLHEVMLTNNYYVGVFQITQAQWTLITGGNVSGFVNAEHSSLRPAENASWIRVRAQAANGSHGTSVTTAHTPYFWPNDPHTGSLLGLLRSKTGLDFDLPGEAQWEFACRAGHGNGYFGNGAAYNIANLPGRCNANGGNPRVGDENYGNTDTNNWTSANGTAECGSYAPNSWGIYDMQGNVTEWCLDVYTNNISTLHGAISTAGTGHRVCRGGGWDQGLGNTASETRDFSNPASATKRRGVRVFCRAGLE